MANKKNSIKPFIFLIVVCGTIAVTAYFARGLFYQSITVHQLLTENKNLKKAITNLTSEDQIGYAKVLSQKQTDAGLATTIKFVETARGDDRKPVLERQYTFMGDTIFFDALIVKFGEQMVLDGKQRSMYLWRRVYDEGTPPSSGFQIEKPNCEPKRYADVLKLLPSEQRNMFWTNIWDLANDPNKLKKYDIHAVYGNAVYSKLIPGMIYIFRINPQGQLYPEVVPDI